MLDLKLIQDTIEELEMDETNFLNCQNLASLYIVREYFQPNSYREPKNVEKELSDIIPRYKEYCDIKKRYQMSEVAKEAVLNSMQFLCKDIIEFLDTLYSNTDMEEERIYLNNMFSLIGEKFNK